MSKNSSNVLISIMFLLLSLGFPQVTLADSKIELGNHICYGTNIVWEGILHEDVGDNKFITIIESLTKRHRKRFGRCLSCKIAGNYIKFFYGNAEVVVKTYVADDRITGLWVNEIKFKNDSLKKIEEDLNKLSGKVSASVVGENGTKFFDLNDDTPLSIASSFKLFVLKALEDKIKSGEIKWDDVVILKDNQRSYPSGMMQDWLAGTPVTVKTLATLMISISDNTASDILIDLLGRTGVEKYAPLNKPFMKVKETFVFEHKNSKGLLKKYLKSNYETKLKILDEISSKKIPPLETYLEAQDKLEGPVKDVGWFATTSELCNVAFALKDEPIITINPGVLNNRKKWPFIGYKGGSSYGVRQFTQILKSNKNNWYCVSATWNDQKEVDEDILKEFASRLAALLPE